MSATQSKGSDPMTYPARAFQVLSDTMCKLLIGYDLEIPEAFSDKIKFVNLYELDDGIINIEVSILVPIKPAERGTLLLDLEDTLCCLNKNYRVWHSALGDKNSLRNLRGVSL